MPHAPVLIPEVGGGREEQVQSTVDALWRAAEEVIAARPDSILLISPHSPRRPTQYGLWSGDTLSGDMSRFGRPDVTISLPNDLEMALAVGRICERHRVGTWEIPDGPIDHGAFVPLYFLTRSGWEGPTAVLSLTALGGSDWRTVGQSICEAVEKLGRRTAVIASGDMSHSLLPDAPCGFQPRAKEFDRTFVERVRAGDYEQLALIDPPLQELASEDVVDSTLIAAGAVGMSSRNHEVFSYEGPFGVGYCIARLFGGNGLHDDGGTCLPEIAREAVEHQLGRGHPAKSWPLNKFLKGAAGVFVTIRGSQGELRGCRGTIEPRHNNLVEETRAVALSSAFEDSRFEPVNADELDGLHYEVSVLHPAEPVKGMSDLDPHTYGVIVRTPDGRRGLMLPEVEGLDSVEKQIMATCRKAYIDPREPMSFERFKVDKFKEN